MTINPQGLNTSSRSLKTKNKQRSNPEIDAQFRKLFAASVNQDYQRKVREIVTVSGQILQFDKKLSRGCRGPAQVINKISCHVR